MVDERDLFKLIDAHVSKVLDYAQLALPTDKFAHYRSLVLDEFGHKGARPEISKLLRQGGQSGEMARNGLGRTEIGKKGRCPMIE